MGASPSPEGGCGYGEKPRNRGRVRKAIDRMGSITGIIPASCTESESSKVVSQEVPVHYISSAPPKNSSMRACNTIQ